MHAPTAKGIIYSEFPERKAQIKRIHHPQGAGDELKRVSLQFLAPRRHLLTETLVLNVGAIHGHDNPDHFVKRMCFFIVWGATLCGEWTGLIAASAFALWYESEYYVPRREKKECRDNATQTEAFAQAESSTSQGTSEAGTDEEETQMLLEAYFTSGTERNP